MTNENLVLISTKIESGYSHMAQCRASFKLLQPIIRENRSPAVGVEDFGLQNGSITSSITANFKRKRRNMGNMSSHGKDWKLKWPLGNISALRCEGRVGAKANPMEPINTNSQDGKSVTTQTRPCRLKS